MLDVEPKSKNGSQVLALCGGVGGAKLALGLYRVLGRDALTVLVNTGDDFEHLSLHVSPDIDTVLYTLGGLADPERGWGRAAETWNCMETLRLLQAEDWFLLGDRDLAVHIERSHRLRQGEALSEIVQDFAARFSILATILPMSDDSVRTEVETEEGLLAFQEYFVRRRCEPKLRGIRYRGAETAQAPARILTALADGTFDAVVICPSNPVLSIDPMLRIPNLRDALAGTRSPVVAVSPLVGGRALKGPAAKILRELGQTPSARTIAEHYGELLDGFVLDAADAQECPTIPVPTLSTRTVMTSLEDREELARACISFARSLAECGGAAARRKEPG